MTEFIKAAKTQDIEAGHGVVADCSGKPVAIFNIGGEFHAVANTCPHRGGPLGEGECEGAIVTCPWHAWRFDVTTGCNADNPSLKIIKYKLKVDGDDILVEI